MISAKVISQRQGKVVRIFDENRNVPLRDIPIIRDSTSGLAGLQVQGSFQALGLPTEAADHDIAFAALVGYHAYLISGSKMKTIVQKAEARLGATAYVAPPPFISIVPKNQSTRPEPRPEFRGGEPRHSANPTDRVKGDPVEELLLAHFNNMKGTGRVTSGPTEKKRPTDTTLCFGHDFKCSFVGDVLHASFLGYRFEIDILDCCKIHDIEMWCGPCSAESAGTELLKMNFDLATCVADKVYTRIFQQMPWYLGGVITGAIFGGVMAAATFALFLSAVEAYTLAKVLLSNDESFYGVYGGNKNSCLCGGSEKTVAHCGEPDAFDMCKDYKGWGKKCGL